MSRQIGYLWAFGLQGVGCPWKMDIFYLVGNVQLLRFSKRMLKKIPLPAEGTSASSSGAGLLALRARRLPPSGSYVDTARACVRAWHDVWPFARPAVIF